MKFLLSIFCFSLLLGPIYGQLTTFSALTGVSLAYSTLDDFEDSAFSISTGYKAGAGLNRTDGKWKGKFQLYWNQLNSILRSDLIDIDTKASYIGANLIYGYQFAGKDNPWYIDFGIYSTGRLSNMEDKSIDFISGLVIEDEFNKVYVDGGLVIGVSQSYNWGDIEFRSKIGLSNISDASPIYIRQPVVVNVGFNLFR